MFYYLKSGKNILHIAVQHNRSEVSKWIINQNVVPVDSTDNVSVTVFVVVTVYMYMCM